MNDEMQQKLLITIKEFCFACDISYSKYREEVLAGRITPIPIGLRGVRLHREEVAKWVERCLRERGTVRT